MKYGAKSEGTNRQLATSKDKNLAAINNKLKKSEQEDKDFSEIKSKIF